MATPTVVNPKTGEKITYYLEDKLKKNLDTKVIPSLGKKDKDCVIALDGTEGSGKSTLAFQIAKYVDNTFNLNRVVFTAEEFRQAIYKAKKGEAVVYDEAFTGLSSRASLSGINRALVSLMMQMRQKNLLVIIVLPTFFLLDKYVAMFRTRALIHVYESKGRRGYFKLYNRKLKKLLYIYGKPTFSYVPNKVRTGFRGHFYGKFALGGPKVEEKYRKKKMKALEDTEKNPMTAGQVKYREQRDIMLYLIRKMTGLTYEKLSNLLGDYDLEMSHVQIRNVCAKFGDKGRQSVEETINILEKLLEDVKKPLKEVKTPQNDEKQDNLKVKHGEVEAKLGI